MILKLFTTIVIKAPSALFIGRFYVNFVFLKVFNNKVPQLCKNNHDKFCVVCERKEGGGGRGLKNSLRERLRIAGTSKKSNKFSL